MANLLKRTTWTLALATIAASLPASARWTDADNYGSASQPAAATRTVEIKPDTRYVLVTRSESVKFVANGKEFAWTFDRVASVFSLNQVAPQGFLDHAVSVNVQPNPNLGGGGGGY